MFCTDGSSTSYSCFEIVCILVIPCIEIRNLYDFRLMHHVVFLRHGTGPSRIFFLVCQVCPAELRMRQTRPQDSSNNYHAHRNALRINTCAERGSYTGSEYAVANEQCSEPVEMRVKLANGLIARRQHETAAHQIVADWQKDDGG